MQYSIIPTSLGPIIKCGDEYLSLHDIDGLLGIYETDPMMTKHIEDHIVENLKSAIDDIVDGFVHGVDIPNQKIQNYLASIKAATEFKYRHALPFMQSISQLNS